MGQLLYGSPPETFEFDDRTLAHVEIVILAKLRRNETFALSVDGEGGTRTAVWLSPASTITFRYQDSAQTINRGWLEELIESANTPAGLKITPEPTA